MSNSTPPPPRRKLRPRPPVTASPIAVSDLTSLDLVGLTAGQLRELARREPNAGWSRVGQRLIIRADKLLVLLDRLSSSDSVDADEKLAAGIARVVAIGNDEPDTVDDVLAILGRRSA